MHILQEKITPKGAKIALETDMSSALFGYTKTTDETSTSYPNDSNMSNIQEWVKYRSK